MTTRRYQYAYAIVDPSDNDICIEVRDTTIESNNPNFIPIHPYNEEYLFKYYNRANGKWYTDPQKLNEWIPA